MTRNKINMSIKITSLRSIPIIYG